jgi:hypothetical protein
VTDILETTSLTKSLSKDLLTVLTTAATKHSSSAHARSARSLLEDTIGEVDGPQMIQKGMVGTKHLMTAKYCIVCITSLLFSMSMMSRRLLWLGQSMNTIGYFIMMPLLSLMTAITMNDGPKEGFMLSTTLLKGSQTYYSSSAHQGLWSKDG